MEQKIKVFGKYQLAAWVPGLLAHLMDEGMDYKRARLAALQSGGMIMLTAGHNLIVTTGYELLASIAAYEQDDLWGIAIGTGNTAPVIDDEALGAEVARAPFSYRAAAGASVERSVIIPEAQCSVHVYEAGVFGGSNASLTLDSGILFARYLVEYDNSAGGADLTLDHTLTYQAA